MPGYLFLIVYMGICLFFGTELLYFLLPDPQRLFLGIAPKKTTLTLIPTQLFYLPAGFIIGLCLITFFNYWIALLMTPFIPADMHVLYPANVVTICLFLYLGSFFWQKGYARRNPPPPEEIPEEPVRRRRNGTPVPQKKSPKVKKALPLLPKFYNRTTGSMLFFGFALVLFALAAFALFYYSFHANGSKVGAGYSVFSDLSPHTALISSFSHGLNFPTDYPHFPGEGIRYHFLFYFLCGNLNLMGLRIDNALNIPSALTMIACFILLGVLAVLITGRRATFWLAPVLVLFRSSFAIVTQISDLAANSHIVTAAEVAALPASVSSNSVLLAIHRFFTNTVWIGDTPYDNWGLWAVNVYANQRHLMLGVALLLNLVILFLPHVRRMFLHVRKAEGFRDKIRQFMFCREAWLPRKNDPLKPYSLILIALLIVICMPFFHGAALIAALVLLFGMAIFSENRLAYLAIALCSVGSALLQAQFFSGGAGNVASLSFLPGFVVDHPDLLNVAIYMGKVTGLVSILILILLFAQKNLYRSVLILIFGLPTLFAFLFSVSKEITANHKFIQISLILFTIFLASLLAFLWKPFAPDKDRPDSDGNADLPAPKRHSVKRIFALIGTRTLAVILFLTLTATGISEWVVYYNLNKNSVEMNLNSSMVNWIESNTEPRSVFLTAPYAMNTFFLSGRFAYYGHPYYAWSAGYDTESRMDIYAQLLTGCGGSLENFTKLCHQENITYILVDNDLRSVSDFTFDESFFNNNLELVASFPDENSTIIYKVG